MPIRSRYNLLLVACGIKEVDVVLLGTLPLSPALFLHPVF
jgi:hypothetical protein